MKRFLIPFFVLVLSIPGQSQREVTLPDIFMGMFFPQQVESVRSMNDGENFTVLEKENDKRKVVKYSYKDFSGEGEIVVPAGIKDDSGNELKVQEYDFNRDEDKVLLATDQEYIYRRSFTATYFIYDLATKKVTPLTDSKGDQMLAQFSPDGGKVAFVRDNNLFVKDLTSGKETAITTDGMKNQVINGATDWVYEEEFALTKGFYWSKASDRIAFYRFDETDVRQYQLKMYGELYPEIHEYKYPKAGEDNAKLSLHIHDLGSSKTVALELGKFEYIPRIKWTKSNDVLMVELMNRHQDELRYVSVDWNGGKPQTKDIYSEKADTYVEIDDNLIFLNDGSFLRTSEKDGFMHIYRIGMDGTAKQITKGAWDVIELKGVDDKNTRVYYTSAEGGAVQKGVYSIAMDGSKKVRLTPWEGGHSDAQFSKGMKYFIHTYSDLGTPTITTLHNSKGKKLETLQDNAELVARLKEYALSPVELMKLPGATDSLNAFMIKPKDFDPGKTYPVYFHVYCGPGRNMVEDAYSGFWRFYNQMLADRGYIVVTVDTRGTMYRGASFKKSTYIQLGKLETEDLMAVAQHLQEESYVDPERIGIMGWSYGGYMTSLAMTKGADIFRMGIAVAPVTNWRYYDNIYTERFMRTPQENPDGYDDNSPINHVEKMKGSYLIVHGTADDNVHPQNTMEMVGKLVEKNKDFDMFMYPNKAHGIGGMSRYHLLNKMLKFTMENL